MADRPGVHRLRWSPLSGVHVVAHRAGHGPGPGAWSGSAEAGVARGEGSHWTERAQALLAPLLHAAALEGADMRTVLTWVDRRQALPAQQALSGLDGGDRGIARDLLDGIVTTDERELSGIWSTASGALGGFRSDRGPGRHL